MKDKRKRFIAIWLSIVIILLIALLIGVNRMTIFNLTKSWFVLVVALNIIIWCYAIYLAKYNPAKKHAKRIILSCLLTIVSLITIAASFGVSQFTLAVNQFLMRPKPTAELPTATAQSKQMVERLEDNGIVLLKNKNNCLPLDKIRVNVFGSAAAKPIYGGSGSGSGNEANNITLKKGLENSGFKVNQQLFSFYDKHKLSTKKQNNFALLGGDYRLKEPNLSKQLLDNAKQYSNTALIVLGRRGGEGGDLPTSMKNINGSNKSYLQLTSEEKTMVDKVEKEGFKKIIVIINSSNAMELGFLNNPKITATLFIGGPGATGMNSVGKVLAGKVDPSGRTVDTFAYNAKSSPAAQNMGDYGYVNSPKTKYVDYCEGIYVGYRYYETRYLNNQKAYRKAVQYPFGYGLSYTKFKQNIISYKANADTIEMTVRVKNIGDRAGKDVVQLYYSAPYYKGGIEKSAINLAAYNKTKNLKPGKSQNVKLSFPVSNMASYDYKNAKAYVLDRGNYDIRLMNNSHDQIASRSYHVDKTIIYNHGRKISGDLISASNQFDEANGNLKYLSRSNWSKTFPKSNANKKISKALLKKINSSVVTQDANASDIKTHNYGLKLRNLRGVPANSEKWNHYVDQFSVNQMKTLINSGLYSTQAIPSQGVPGTIDTDGPAGLNDILRGINGVQYCSSVMVASTWDKNLIQEAGKTLGKELRAHHQVGLYGPAVNIHRTPFSGRNFEYYSEDPIVSGESAASFVKGSRKEGIITYVKHFALNDQETNRTAGVSVWANEQAIREIYLNAFRIPVEKGKTLAIMSSYNRIGSIWTGADKHLMTNVLRHEWGFPGLVETDMAITSYQNINQGIRAGNDLLMSALGQGYLTSVSDTKTGRQAMRQATKHQLYAIANSAALNVKLFPTWIIWFVLVEILILSLIMFGFKHLFTKKNN